MLWILANIKCKTKFTPPVIQIMFTCMYYMFISSHLLDSSCLQGGITSLIRGRRTFVILTIERFLYDPGSEVHGIWTPTDLKSLWNILDIEVYLQSHKNCKELINVTDIRWRHPHHMHIGYPSLLIQQGISHETGHPSLLMFLFILYIP